MSYTFTPPTSGIYRMTSQTIFNGISSWYIMSIGEGEYSYTLHGSSIDELNAISDTLKDLLIF